jgi:hypothetical protein
MTLFIKQEMIDQLVGLHERYSDQAVRCAQAGVHEAAFVMMASAVETMLFSTITMSEHVLRDSDLWPEKHPFDWTLGTMIGIATRAGWFEDHGIPGADLGAAVEGVNLVRVGVLHPAAYIRDGGLPLSERQLAAAFAVLLAVDDALGHVVSELPPPSEPQS